MVYGQQAVGTYGQTIPQGVTGALNSTASAPPQPQFFEQLEQRYATTNDQLAMLTQRIATLADRLVGSRPQAVSDSAKDPMPNCALARVSASADRLDYWVGCASEELSRLERL